MTQVLTTQSPARVATGALPEPAWLATRRQEARALFATLGYPTTKQEAWRDTNLAPLSQTNFHPAPVRPDAAEALARHTFGSDAAAELVFVNGHFAPHLSKLAGLPRGVKLSPLSVALAEPGTALETHLSRHADIGQSGLVALNTAAFTDGTLVHIARSVTVERPIHLLYLTTAEAEPVATHPRVLLLLDENAEASVVETYAGTTGTYFTNAVTEIVLAPHSRLDHCKLQSESLAAFHLAATQVQVLEHANFVSHSATLGAALSRNDLNVRLDGEYAAATLNGLVLVSGTQHADNHTLLHHEKPNCPSHELYKHVLDGRATGVFKGKIFVQKDAQKTDSKQTSKTLLLSDTASMQSQPALEIYADDVKCTHGSTTGPVDEEMVFYIRSRGVSLETARHLLTYAFAADITRRIRVEPVRRYLEEVMAAQHGLPQDLRITDLGSAQEKSR